MNILSAPPPDNEVNQAWLQMLMLITPKPAFWIGNFDVESLPAWLIAAGANIGFPSEALGYSMISPSGTWIGVAYDVVMPTELVEYTSMVDGDWFRIVERVDDGGALKSYLEIRWNRVDEYDYWFSGYEGAWHIELDGRLVGFYLMATDTGGAFLDVGTL